METLRIPYPGERAERRGIEKKHWNVLINTTFPNAVETHAILTAWDLAGMRGLEVFNGHIAIVKQSRYDRSSNTWVDYEACWLTNKALIHLAHRTGTFAGIDRVDFGPVVDKTFEGHERNRGGRNTAREVRIRVPEHATATVYRFVKGERCAFSDTVYFDEAVPISQGLPTTIWQKKPSLMLAKCAKAAALRLGFAECDHAAEEMEGQSAIEDVIHDLNASAVSDDHHDQSDHDDQHRQMAPNSRQVQHTGDNPGFADVIDSFADLPKPSVEWLDRNMETAIAVGSFAELYDTMKGALDQASHEIGEKLFRAAETLSGAAQAPQIWQYIKGARQHGGQAFEQATANFRAKAKCGQVPEDVSTAAETVLTFMKVAEAA